MELGQRVGHAVERLEGIVIEQNMDLKPFVLNCMDWRIGKTVMYVVHLTDQSEIRRRGQLAVEAVA